MKRCLAWRGLVALPVLASLLSLPALSIAQDRQARSWGYNSNGELGDGTALHRINPCKASGFCNALQIAGGRFHTVSLKTDGTVWAWGRNNYGQLGNGGKAFYCKPLQVPGITDAVQVACGAFHSLALKSDGSVWAWGCNSAGQLGDGTSQSHFAPSPVVGLSNIVQIAGGRLHSVALKSDGTVWAWGANSFGQLGDGTNTDKPVPVQITALQSVTSLSSGALHSLAVKSDGTAWAWGANMSGQLGDGSYEDNASPVQVYALEGATQVSGGGLHSLALKADGTVWAWGGDYGGYATLVSGVSNVWQIASGGLHSIALKSDGTVWTWGRNAYGQLGNGTNQDSDAPVQVKGITGVTRISGGYYHSLALMRPPRLDGYAIAGYFGSKQTLRARIRRRPDGAGLAGAKVSFTIDGVKAGSAIADENGFAKLPFKLEDSLAVGSHTIVATYSGDAETAPNSVAAKLEALQTPSLLLGSNLAGKIGATLAIRVRLKRTSDLNGVAAQRVVFQMDGADLGAALTDSAGVATLLYAIPETSIGSHAWTASFAATSQYAGALNAGTLEIAKSGARIAAADATGASGGAVNLTAILKRSTDGNSLEGRRVAFRLDGTLVGVAATDANGLASLPFAIPADMKGSKKIKATFDGDDYHAPAAGSATLTVN